MPNEIRKKLEAWCMDFHHHMRERRVLRQALPVQVLPDDVMHQHGIKTNDEFVTEVLGPIPAFPVMEEEHGDD